MARGTLYLMLANTLFAIVGYIIHFGLGRHLGPVDYGTFGVVLYLMTTVNLVITSGIPQSASKHIAEDYSRAGGIIRSTNRIQAVFSVLILGLYLGLSGVISGWLNDASLTPYIRISALAIPTYAVFSIYNAGYLNGLRRFGQQAISTTGASLAKAGLVFLLVLVGFGIKGAIIGYAASALIGFLLAWNFLRSDRQRQTSYPWKILVKFGIPATLFATAFFLLMSIDLFAVKALVGGDAAGYYTSATTISKVPYYLFAGLAMALLPSVSKALSANDIELARSYIRQSMRYMLILLVPGVLLISATSSDLLTLVYSSRYLPAGTPLAILAIGTGLLSIFFVLAHIIMGSGKPWVVLMIALMTVIISFGLNIWLVPRYDLIGAAWATTATGIIGTGVAAVYTLYRFKTLVPPLSLMRIGMASLAIYFIAYYITVPPAYLPLLYLAWLALYAGMLILTRELTTKDLSLIKGIIPGERFTGGNSSMP
jgi:stage V sporulation protein B